MTDRARESGETGHVLVEALIAVLIVAGMTGLLFDTLSAQARAARQLDERRAAVLVARSRLAAALAGEAMADEGETDGLHWSLSIEPYDSGARSGPLELSLVRVEVTEPATPKRPLALLQSLKVGP